MPDTVDNYGLAPLVTRSEAAQFLKVCARTVARRLRGRKLGPRLVRYTRQEILDYVESGATN